MRKTAYLVAGLGFGDEGKGATVDYLCRTEGARLVVRYNGGAQAAHTVVTSNGREHVFSQFGSGTLVEGVETYLGPEVIINPLSMMEEEGHLAELGITDAWERLIIDPACIVVTPFHRTLNRIREQLRGEGRHGSCGVGVGEAYEFALRNSTTITAELIATNLKRALSFLESIRREVSEIVESLDLRPERWTPEVAAGIQFVQDSRVIDRIGQHWEHWLKYAKVGPRTTWVSLGDVELQGMFNRNVVVFEGAQGVLLDREYGTAPYHSWTDTTFLPARRILKTADPFYKMNLVRVGVLRSYYTRHGAGPFPTETSCVVAPPEKHNDSSGFQGAFRVGEFDLFSAQYALRCLDGVDELVINHMDRDISSGWRACTDHYPDKQYEQFHDKDRFIERIERYLQIPVTITGWGPRAEDRQRRTAWQSRMGRIPAPLLTRSVTTQA